MKWKRSKKAQQEAKQKSEGNSSEHKTNSSTSSSATHGDQKSNNSTLNDCVSEKHSKISFSNTANEQSLKSSKGQTNDFSQSSQSSVSSPNSSTSCPQVSGWTSGVSRHLAECGRSATNLGANSHSISSSSSHQVVPESFYRPYVS
jgi:hypothetical protein